MSKATNRQIQNQVSEARQNLGMMTIFAVAVSDYQYIRRLRGAEQDLVKIRQIFVDNPATSLYSEEQLITLSNPTSSELRRAVLEFTESRGARGDIVIFYFSGHGSVLGGGEFLLCTTDSRPNQRIDGGGILSTSSVLFRDIVHSFSSVDIRPIFIIDACFSGTIGLSDDFQIGQMMQNEAFTFGNTYGLLCSSSSEAESKDTPEGGLFTIRLHEAAENGMSGNFYKNKPLLTLNDIAIPLVESLSRDGYPLSRLFFGPQLPQIGISKNIQYQLEFEYFPPMYRQIIELIWNNGEPTEMHIEELGRRIGRGAYSNHSKLSLPPWGLLQDGQSRSHGILTERGILFSQGVFAIPRRVIKDPESWEWIADPESEMVFISDIGD
ncbi:MAG: caspase family protein [Pelolinea sp.]|nr:caspase family protein [Pelolinea sp.]